MATSFSFGGKTIKLPGAYGRVTSGRTNPPQNLPYGSILIIDNDNLNSTLASKPGIMGGSGVAGTHKTGKDSIYEFNTIEEFKKFVAHGWWYKAADFLFRPNGSDPGISKVYIIKPSTTVAPTVTFTATGGGAAGGTFKIASLDEGEMANGVLSSSKLKSGYAFTISAGTVDTAKWVFKLWKGTYRGVYSDNLEYDEISLTRALSKPELVCQSPEFNNMSTLISWATTDSQFGKYFKLDATSAVTGLGTIVAGDIPVGFQVLSGGTEAYDSISEALEAVTDLEYDYILTTYANPASPQTDANIIAIKAHLETDSEFGLGLFTYGSDTDLDDTTDSAIAFDSSQVHIVHGTIKKVSSGVASGLRTWSSFFNMCAVVGRLCGLPPQVPITFKKIDIDGVGTKLTETQKIKCLDAGVIAVYYDTKVNDYIVLQGINTLQDNKVILNPDGTSHVIQYNRIAHQLNKELVIGVRRDLLANPDGVNRYTLSEAGLAGYISTYLSRKVATEVADNLILGYGNITVTRDEDSLSGLYEFTPNDEVRIVMVTGFAI